MVESPQVEPSTLRPVSPLDWVIVAFTFLLAVYGYLQGFIVGVLSLVGFVVSARALWHSVADRWRTKTRSIVGALAERATQFSGRES